MIVFKSCIRCQGDVHVKDDQYDQDLDCLQCGAVTDVPDRIDVTSLPEIAKPRNALVKPSSGGGCCRSRRPDTIRASR